ncbi:MAG: twin-arginine translocase TatA/TatE family subunit [Gammaproteobacteria bacterium]|nr:MAG: twin-arginine translocase TatA/TatE family subunit [Gammaproteobacteria bacterium]
MGISIWQLLIILLIVVVLFGTKKIRTMGADLGAALKNFRQAVKEGEEEDKEKLEHARKEGQVIDAEVEVKAKEKA